MHNSQQHGFTLIELLLTLGIIVVVFTSAIPALEDFLNKQKIISHTANLRSVLQLARKTAVTSHQKVTVCPTTSNSTCSGQWSDGYIAFIDKNANRQRDDDDEILFETQLAPQDIQLKWSAFGVRTSMQWHETGITNHQNGTFQLCLKGKAKYARALIITKAGRIRMSDDTDNDGIHENATGSNLVCG